MYHDSGKIKTVDYKGGRTAKEIIEFGMDKAKNLALKRAGLKTSKGGASSGSSSGGGGGSAGALLSVTVLCAYRRTCTVAPVMFGKPLLNNVLSFDHAQLQK